MRLVELASRLSDVSVCEAGVIARPMPPDDEYHRLLSAAGLSASWSRTMQKRRLSGKLKIARRPWGIKLRQNERKIMTEAENAVAIVKEFCGLDDSRC